MLYCSAKTPALKQLADAARVKETTSSPDSSHTARGIMREVSPLWRRGSQACVCGWWEGAGVVMDRKGLKGRCNFPERCDGAAEADGDCLRQSEMTPK